MSRPEHDRRLDYVEFPATDLDATQKFYEAVFGWTFTSYGPTYLAFNDGRLDGGFTTNGPAVGPVGVLVVLYAVDLEAVEADIVANGGTISTPTFSFPGGRRFHFMDPNGNELAVWSDPV